jgi:phage repressor protein C with HTH and peptisase S24 domain
VNQEEFNTSALFAERLAQAIRDSGRSKADIAESVGVKPPALSRWLRGSQPEQRYLVKLGEELNVSVNWLLSGVNDRLNASIPHTPLARLREARVKAGYTPAEFAKKIGYRDAGTYLAIEEGNSQMGEKMAKRAADLLNIPVSDLLGGSDEPPSRSVPIGTFGAIPEINLPPGMRAKFVPLISMAQCGSMRSFTDEIYSKEGFIAFDVSDPKAFAVRLKGDSMVPRIEPGDVAIVSPSQQPRNGGVVLAKLASHPGEDGDVMLKLYNASGDMVTLSSYNPAHPPITYPRSAFQWIYPVSQVTRSL